MVVFKAREPKLGFWRESPDHSKVCGGRLWLQPPRLCQLAPRAGVSCEKLALLTELVLRLWRIEQSYATAARCLVECTHRLFWLVDRVAKCAWL